MTLEQQVCSLDLAKILKKFGVPQRSLFFYQMAFGGGKETSRLTYGKGAEPFDTDEYNISAFSVAELGDMLPPYFCSVDAKRTQKWSCEKWSYGTINAPVPTQYAATEADARAKMLIYLLENKLLVL